MFQKGSFSAPSDTSGVFLAKVIQTRKCSSRKHAKIGRFLKVVIKTTKYIMVKKRKKKSRSIVIRSKHYFRKSDGVSFLFYDNALVLLKKRMNTLGKELLGPTSYSMKIKKFRIPFRYIY